MDKKRGMLIKMSEGIFKNFYNSRRWRRCAKAYAQSKLHICERCGGYKTGSKDDGTRQRWVVHHKNPMDAVTIQDDNLSYVSNATMLSIMRWRPTASTKH